MKLLALALLIQVVTVMSLPFVEFRNALHAYQTLAKEFYPISEQHPENLRKQMEFIVVLKHLFQHSVFSKKEHCPIKNRLPQIAS